MNPYRENDIIRYLDIFEEEKCSEDLLFFTCMMYNPICFKHHIKQVLPCKSVCLNVKNAKTGHFIHSKIKICFILTSSNILSCISELPFKQRVPGNRPKISKARSPHLSQQAPLQIAIISVPPRSPRTFSSFLSLQSSQERRTDRNKK